MKGGVAPQDVSRIFAERLGGPLGLGPEEAAQAVVRMANTKMAGAIRMVSLSLGADPRDFALFAFGGAGPLHAVALARELGVPKVMVPARPGITNAIGCVVADLRHDFVQTVNTPVDALEPGQLAQVFAAQAAEGERLIAKETVALSGIRHLYSADMRFVGQTHLLRVELERPDVDNATLRQLFEAAYFDRFRVELAEIRANVVNANCSVIGTRERIDLSTLIDPAGRKATLAMAQSGTRQVLFDGGWAETPVYWRDHLPLEFTLEGPAIIQQMDTTVLIEPGNRAKGDMHGNVFINVSMGA